MKKTLILFATLMLAGIGQDYGADSWFPVFSGKKQV